MPRRTENERKGKREMNEFKAYHPMVNFAFFVCAICFSVLLMHPACLFVSLFSSLAYLAVLKGRKTLLAHLLYMLPLALATALINAAFNHEGATILAYLPGGNPLTLESVVYGLCAAAMILSVICWFSCYNEVMTSDKFIYLFGRVSPALSLIFSMTLRFVPRFTEKLREVTIARRSLGKGAGNRNVRARIKSGLSSLSATLTWALENSIETADSMKARGYGIPGRTSFSIYIFEKKDKIALALIFALSLCVIYGRICGSLSFSYFPTFGVARSDFAAVSSVFGYFLLCVMPIIIELKGVRRWKKSE